MPKTAADLLFAREGVRTTRRVNRVAASVGIAAAQVFRQDPNRIGFRFVNLSLNAMYLGSWSDVSSTKGIYVGPNGGSALALWDEDGEEVGYEWFVIADGAASAYLAVETLVQPER